LKKFLISWQKLSSIPLEWSFLFRSTWTFNHLFKQTKVLYVLNKSLTIMTDILCTFVIWILCNYIVSAFSWKKRGSLLLSIIKSWRKKNKYYMYHIYLCSSHVLVNLKCSWSCITWTKWAVHYVQQCTAFMSKLDWDELWSDFTLTRTKKCIIYHNVHVHDSCVYSRWKILHEIPLHISVNGLCPFRLKPFRLIAISPKNLCHFA
jgi:hypothetical protein